MDALEAIRTRRSTRKLLDRPVPRDLLEQVVEAARAASSGNNSQTTHLIVVQGREDLDELARVVREEFAKMEVGPDTYRSLANSIAASRRGGYVFHYHAPVLIVVANKRGYGNAMADSACAMENMMIAANALDLGSCYINQLHWLDGNPRVAGLLRELGLEEDETVCASLAVGYPDAQDGLPNRAERKVTGNPVTW